MIHVVHDGAAARQQPVDGVLQCVQRQTAAVSRPVEERGAHVCRVDRLAGGRHMRVDGPALPCRDVGGHDGTEQTDVRQDMRAEHVAKPCQEIRAEGVGHKVCVAAANQLLTGVDVEIEHRIAAAKREDGVVQTSGDEKLAAPATPHPGLAAHAVTAIAQYGELLRREHQDVGVDPDRQVVCLELLAQP